MRNAGRLDGHKWLKADILVMRLMGWSNCEVIEESRNNLCALLIQQGMNNPQGGDDRSWAYRSFYSFANEYQSGMMRTTISHWPLEGGGLIHNRVCSQYHGLSFTHLRPG